MRVGTSESKGTLSFIFAWSGLRYVRTKDTVDDLQDA